MTGKNKTAPITVLLWGLCLLLSRTAYTENKGPENNTSSCQHPFLKKMTAADTIRSRPTQLLQSWRKNAVPSLQETLQSAKKDITLAIGYSSRPALDPALDPNDSHAIHQALSTTQGAGAAIIDIRPFTPEIAEKIRIALCLANPKHYYRHRNDRSIKKIKGIHFSPESYTEDWKAFKQWLLSKTQIISPEEIDQFQQEAEHFLSEVKQTILKSDGENIELSSLLIRPNGARYYTSAHRDVYPDNYITAALAPVGLSTYYHVDNGWLFPSKVLSSLGQAIIMSEQGRINTLSEHGEPVMHGTPSRFRERLVLIAIFKKANKNEVSLQ